MSIYSLYNVKFIQIYKNVDKIMDFKLLKRYIAQYSIIRLKKFLGHNIKETAVICTMPPIASR